jgi:hypothetical protein
MDNPTLAAENGLVGRSRKARAGYVVAALGVAFAVVVLLQNQAANAQLDFGQVFCQAILSVIAAFRDSPFFAFIRDILVGLANLFNCVISPAL